MASYIAALDIGSSRITLAVAVRDRDGVGVRRFYGSVPSHGVEKHVISNRSDVAQCIQTLLERMGTRLGLQIDTVHFAYSAAGVINCQKIYLDITCNTRESNDSHTTVIARQDIEALDQGCERRCDPLHHLVDREALTYYADKAPIRSSLEGTYAAVFGCDYNIFVVEKEAHERLVRLFRQLNLRVPSMPLGIRGSVEAISTPEQRRQGIAVLDVGAERSQLAVYYEDQLRHYAWIEIGGDSITRDIAKEHRLEARVAEHSKLHEVYNLSAAVDYLLRMLHNEPISTEREGAVDMVVCAVVYYLVERVMKHLDQWDVLHRLEANGLVITGGGISFAEIEGVFSEFASRHYPLRVRVGQPPTAERVESITGGEDISDLMRILPVIGLLEMELHNLDAPSDASVAPAGSVPSREGTEPDVTVAPTNQEGNGWVGRVWRKVSSSIKDALSDTE